jgi:hypothetical protein
VAELANPPEGRRQGKTVVNSRGWQGEGKRSCPSVRNTGQVQGNPSGCHRVRGRKNAFRVVITRGQDEKLLHKYWDSFYR